MQQCADIQKYFLATTLNSWGKKQERICKFAGVRSKTLSASVALPHNWEHTPCFFRPVAATNFLCAEVFQIGYDTIVDGAWRTGSRHATSELMQFACLLGPGFIKKQWTECRCQCPEQVPSVQWKPVTLINIATETAIKTVRSKCAAQNEKYHWKTSLFWTLSEEVTRTSVELTEFWFVQICEQLPMHATFYIFAECNFSCSHPNQVWL